MGKDCLACNHCIDEGHFLCIRTEPHIIIEDPTESCDNWEEAEEYARAEPSLAFVYDDGFLTSWKLTPVEAKE